MKGILLFLISLSLQAQVKPEPETVLIFCETKTMKYEFDFAKLTQSVAIFKQNGTLKREPIEMTFTKRPEDRLVVLLHPLSKIPESWFLPISLFDTFNIGTPVLVTGRSPFLRLAGECTAQK